MLLSVAVVLLFSMLSACGSKESRPGAGTDTTATASADTGAAALAYRNTVDSVPAGWTGRVFKLSHDYPTALPPGDPKATFPWLKMPMDFKAGSVRWSEQMNAYIMSILDYVKQGQDPNLRNEIGFLTSVDGAVRWFHIPWMAYDPTAGREFIHGTTNERTAYRSDFLGGGKGIRGHTLAGTQESGPRFETWAVGMYNEYGAYAVGQAWAKSGTPNTYQENGRTFQKGLPFPEGTVVCKVLYTTAKPEQVPYLKGSSEWTVNRHVQLTDSTFGCERTPQSVYLVQVDVAVVDLRSPTRWVMGTFAYNGTKTGATVWERLSPVGLQWGMDPQTFPAVPEKESIPAHESVLAPIDIYEHDGCNKRLAGPVDNPLSSCLSCHGGAFGPPVGTIAVQGTNIPPIFGFTGQCTEYNDTNKAYFSNIVYPQPYPLGMYPTAVSMDFSLQMWVALSQYGQYNTAHAPAACTN